MRVLLVGASGVIGRRLIPQLIERGHEVFGTCHAPQRADRIRGLGAQPISLDALDATAVSEAVYDIEPEAIVHEATALTGIGDFRHFDRTFAQTNLLRTRGTDVLLKAAREAAVPRFVAQSFAGHRYERVGAAVKDETARLDPAPVAAMRESEVAMNHVDAAVLDAGGIVLRYGAFYGEADDPLVAAVRARQVPIIGDGNGVWSFVHLDDAASATVLALDHDGPNVYHIVDDEPAPTRVWIPELSETLGVRPPRRFPRWLARMVAGQAPVVMGTESRGASNAKAKRELGWTLRYPSWRQGFAQSYT